jgi:hypothetical protein
MQSLQVLEVGEDAIKAQTVDRVNVWIDTSIWPDTTFYKEDTNQEGAATGGGDDLLPSSKRSGLNAKGNRCENIIRRKGWMKMKSNYSLTQIPDLPC